MMILADIILPLNKFIDDSKTTYMCGCHIQTREDGRIGKKICHTCENVHINIKMLKCKEQLFVIDERLDTINYLKTMCELELSYRNDIKNFKNAKMKYIILDTETNGGIGPIIQISWACCDSLGHIIKLYDYNIEHKNRKKQIYTILNKLHKHYLKCEYLVGHNIKTFDIHVIDNEQKEYGLDIINVKKIRLYDTMIEFKRYFNLCDCRGRIKSPKQLEMYKILFGCELNKKFNSRTDVLILVKIFKEMCNRGIVRGKHIDNYFEDT